MLYVAALFVRAFAWVAVVASVVLAVVTEAVWIALIGGCVTVTLAYMQHRMMRVVRATHSLVNSRFGDQLRITANALKRTAEKTGDPEDAKLADEAEKIYEGHMAGQAEADSMEGKNP